VLQSQNVLAALAEEVQCEEVVVHHAVEAHLEAGEVSVAEVEALAVEVVVLRAAEEALVAAEAHPEVEEAEGSVAEDKLDLGYLLGRSGRCMPRRRLHGCLTMYYGRDTNQCGT
jgi:hypothetical protein